MSTYLNLYCETCEVVGPEVRFGWQAHRMTLDEQEWMKFVEEHERHHLRLLWEDVSSPASRPKAEAYQRQAEAAQRAIDSSPGWLRDTAVPPPASVPENEA